MDALLNLGRHLKGSNGKTLRGYALESEGLDSNPVFYDLFTDLFFRPDAVSGDGSIDRWLADYAERRYGVRDGRRTVEIVRKTFNDFLQREGFSDRSYLSWARKTGKLYVDRNDPESRNDVRGRLNGMNVRFVCIYNGE